MAESVLRHYVDDEGLDVEVDSSGTGAWHVGDTADHRTLAALRRAGYRSAHIARQFEPGWFDRYDLIIALDRGHLRELRRMAPDGESAAKVRLLREFDPAAGADLDVPDPYYGGTADFAEVLGLVEAAMPGMLDEIRNGIKDTS